MEQLSGDDSFIRSEERGHNFVHVATLGLCDQASAAGGKLRYKQILAAIGARLLRLYPISMPADCAGLNHTAISCDGSLWISVVACRHMLPDPAFNAECLRASCVARIQRTESDAPVPTPPGRVPRQAKARPVAPGPKIRSPKRAALRTRGSSTRDSASQY